MEKQQLCIVGRHFSMAGKKKNTNNSSERFFDKYI